MSSLLQAEQAQLPQPFFTEKALQPSEHLCGCLLDPFQQLCILLVLGAPGLDAVPQMGPQEGRADGDNPLPCPAATPLLMQPRILLAFHSARALMSSFLSIRTPKSFSTELLSVNFSPSLYLYLGFSRPKCTLHIALLNLIRFSCAHFSSASRSLWMVSLLSIATTVPFN